MSSLRRSSTLVRARHLAAKMAKHLENKQRELERESLADAIKRVELLGRASRGTRMIGLARERETTETERERMVLDRLGAWIKRVRKEEGGRQIERQATSRRRGLHGFLCVHVHARAFVNAR